MSMVEKVARAIDPQAWKAKRSTIARTHSLWMAARAIEALREPTPAMIDSGVAFALNVTIGGEYRWSQYVADKHRSMIDAALVDSPLCEPASAQGRG